MNNKDGQHLIDAFFKALDLMALEQCQEYLDALGGLVQDSPIYHDWHTCLNGVLIYRRDRDWAKSEHIFKSLLEKSLELSLKIRVLLGLGIVHRYQGHFHEALEIYQQCLKILHPSNQVLDRAKTWKNMAIVLEIGFSQGAFGFEALYQASDYCQFALDALQSLENRDKANIWLEATVWNTHGLIYRSLGDWQQATDCFRRRIDLGQFLSNRYGVGIANHNLGEVLQLQGSDKWSDASQAYHAALEIYREPEFDDKYQQIDVLSNLALLHHEMNDLPTALDYYDQAIDLIEIVRASVTAEAGRAGYFTTVADTYANAILLCLEMGETEKAFNLVEQTCSRAFLDVLVAGSVDLPREQELAAPISLAEVQAALPVNALLLEYFTSGLLEVQEGQGQANPNAQRHRFPPAKILLFAITRETFQIHPIALSPNDLRPTNFDTVVEVHFLDTAIRKTLYDHLISPVTSLLAEKERLYLVPHGPLHYIPFQTLLAPDGDTLLRESGPQVIYGPSASLLFRYGRVTPQRAAQSCLAVGYNSAGETQLYYAEDEAQRVAHLSQGHALSGVALKRETLFHQARHYQLLHFACHGEFDPETPLASFLNIGPDEHLTAQEVLESMPLQCDLVTLSACESGLSRVRRGDELIGFNRAFMYAGAPALISTLWRVNDHPTRILMAHFYQAVAEGVGFAEALKLAQLYVKNLTYQEALDLLNEYEENPPEADLPPNLPAGNVADPPPRAVALPPSAAYLRGAASSPSASDQAIAAEPDPAEKIYADPYYWGAFVLAGGHGS